MPQAALERRAIPAVAIVNQKSWRPSIPSAAFDHLLGRPLRGRTWRHRYVQNLSIDVSDHEKDVQSLEQDCSHAEEVTSPYIRFMPSQEPAPSGMAIDYGRASCTWRRSGQKLQIPILRVRLGFFFDPRAGSQ